MKTKLQNLKSIFFFHISAESIEADEAEFGRMLKKRAEDGGKCKVISVAKVESEIEVKEIVTLSKIKYYKSTQIHLFVYKVSHSNFVLIL